MAAACAGAALGAVEPQFWISQEFIGGGEVGMTRSEYREVFGKPVRAGQLEGGLSRLEFPRLDVEVYFRSSRNAGIGVLTWNRSYHTSVGIGPCSTVAQLRRAYGARLVPFRLGGKVAAYRLGRLTFTVEGGKRVGVVMLAGTGLPVFTALNAPECGTPGA
jgi:hypothetical protein